MASFTDSSRIRWPSQSIASSASFASCWRRSAPTNSASFSSSAWGIWLRSTIFLLTLLRRKAVGGWGGWSLARRVLQHRALAAPDLLGDHSRRPAPDIAQVPDLLSRELRCEAEADAALQSCVDADTLALLAQVVLQFGRGADDGAYEPAHRGRRVDRLGETAEADLVVLQPLHDAEQVLQRPSDSVEPDHHQHVARAARFDRPLKFDAALGGGPAFLLGEHLFAPSSLQCRDLGLEVLAFAAHASVPDKLHGI